MKDGLTQGQATKEPLAGNTDTSFLKVVAFLFMMVDHMGVLFYPGVPEMRMLGRIAFPLYAWCLVVGNVKTRNPAKYLLRLLGLALLSQPLYMMALNHNWSYFGILFALAIATVAIQGIRFARYGSQIWIPAVCYILLGYMNVDYGWKGLTFIIVLYLSRSSRAGLLAAFLSYAMFWGASSPAVTSLFGYPLTFLKWNGIGQVFSAFFRLQGMIWLALPLLLIKTNSDFKLPKWLGYGLYPLHLILLIVIRLLNGTQLAVLFAGFKM